MGFAGRKYEIVMEKGGRICGEKDLVGVEVRFAK